MASASNEPLEISQYNHATGWALVKPFLRNVVLEARWAMKAIDSGKVADTNNVMAVPTARTIAMPIHTTPAL